MYLRLRGSGSRDERLELLRHQRLGDPAVIQRSDFRLPEGEKSAAVRIYVGVSSRANKKRPARIPPSRPLDSPECLSAFSIRHSSLTGEA